MLFGLMLAYWINYGFYFHKSAVQWRFPLLFQLVFALYIMVVTPFLPDTPRWLMRHEDSHERGMTVLSKLRNKPISHPVVQSEVNDILEAIRVESQEEGAWSDLFRSNGIAANKRFYLALGIQFMQQMSGINIVSSACTLPLSAVANRNRSLVRLYNIVKAMQRLTTADYAPTLFQSSLGFSAQMALLMGCALQVWYILASFVTWYTIDRVGRRPLLISMAMGMCLFLVLEAICVAIGGTGPGIAAVVFVFMFEACFTWGWMGCVWVVRGLLMCPRSTSDADISPSIRPRSCHSRSEPKAPRWQPEQTFLATS